MKSDIEGADNSARPIFLHGQFRCGSTFLFNRFRSSDQFYTYYEPLHHDLVRIRRNKIDLWGFDSKTTGKVNHPELAKPHFYEYRECFSTEGGSLPFFDKGYSYDQFYQVSDDRFDSYIENLLQSVPAGRRPVLQFNRTSLRIDWFAKNRSAGLNVALIRNPRDQFDSYVSTGNNVFLIMNLIIISRSSPVNPFARLTRELFLSEYKSKAINREIRHYSKIVKSIPLAVHYRIFLSIWIEAYKHSSLYADLIINMNRISSDIGYRNDIENKIGFKGLFDGYKLRVKQKHRLKNHRIVDVENEVFFGLDEKFISGLRKEYDFAELDGTASQGRVRGGLIAATEKVSSVFAKKNADRGKQVPVISIITPSYNQAEFIDETIKSVLEQKGEFYIDYIIVDGLSDDGSVGIIESNQSCCTKGECQVIDGLKYYKNDSIHCSGISFRYISEKDNGQANALNKGFEMSVGNLLGWINSDDIYYSPNTLSFVVNGFADKSTNFLYGRGVRVDRNGIFVREESYVNNFRPVKIRQVDFILQPSAFWRREVYEAIGMLNEGYHYVFDWDYWVRISEQFELRKNKNILSCYRVYGETKTSVGGDARENEIVTLLKSYNSYNNEAIRLNNLGKIDESI